VFYGKGLEDVSGSGGGAVRQDGSTQSGTLVTLSVILSFTSEGNACARTNLKEKIRLKCVCMEQAAAELGLAKRNKDNPQ
jgi:hypothetical protein